MTAVLDASSRLTMQPYLPQSHLPNLQGAIDYHPLIVPPEMLLTEVVVLMSQTRGRACSLGSLGITDDPTPMQGARSSCVLISQGRELLGIFTERDIVKLTATGIPFAGVPIADVMVHPVITLQETAFQDIFAALFLFRRYRIRHLVLVNQENQWIGVVSPTSIRQVLQPTNLLKIRRVAEVMATRVIHAAPITSVLSLVQLMADHRVSCVVIAEETSFHDRLSAILPVGIVTESDIVQFQALGLNLAEIEAQTVMSTPLFLLTPDDSLWTAHQVMQHHRVQRLVVSWDWGAKLAIVTQTSLLRIFDPIELYGVIETLQHSLYQVNHSQLPSLPSTETIPNSSSYPDIDLEEIIASLQERLEVLITHPDLSLEVRQTSLRVALADVQALRSRITQPEAPIDRRQC